MIEKYTSSMGNKLLNEFKDLLVRSIVNSSEVKKQGIIKDSTQKFLLKELDDFIDKDGDVKQWLRARCLESVIASAGLNEYLKTLLSFRGSSPSKIAPLNIMFASSQIARALDPIVVRILKELYSRKRLSLSEQKLNALTAILSPTLNFSVAKSEVYFDVEEVEQLRNLLLEIALERFLSRPIQDVPRSAHKLPRLKPIGKAPDISFERLVDVSKNYANLNISLKKGVLQWQYGIEPTIFVKDGICFYDQLEVDSKGIGYDLVKRQFYLMKKTIYRTSKKMAPR